VIQHRCLLDTSLIGKAIYRNAIRFSLRLRDEDRSQRVVSSIRGFASSARLAIMAQYKVSDSVEIMGGRPHGAFG
jgi:hypothetical protein